MTRTDITFPSSGDTCAAWLYTPEQADQNHPRPLIVMAHGLGGVREMRLDAFADRFTEAGYLCLVFDYRHFGGSTGQPRQLLDIRRQLADWHAAVAHARTLPGADPDRIILWGTSFSGGHVLETAAADDRIAAVISQCPFTDGLASSLVIPPLTSLKVTARALRDLWAALRGRPPVMIPTYGHPGDTALMTAPDNARGQEQILPARTDGPEIPMEVAARFALDIIRYYPGRKAREIQSPVFFAICGPDSVAPSGPTQRYAAQVPDAEIRLYDAGHFDIYVGEDFERNVADQLDFLTRAVPVHG